MKGKVSKKEQKKVKSDAAATKVKSDYQNDKTRKLLPETILNKLKK